MHNNIDACARDDARARINTERCMAHIHAATVNLHLFVAVILLHPPARTPREASDSKDSRLYINASRSLSMSHASSGGSVRRHRLFSSMRRRSSSSQISSSSFRVHARGRRRRPRSSVGNAGSSVGNAGRFRRRRRRRRRAHRDSSRRRVSSGRPARQSGGVWGGAR